MLNWVIKNQAPLTAVNYILTAVLAVALIIVTVWGALTAGSLQAHSYEVNIKLNYARTDDFSSTGPQPAIYTLRIELANAGPGNADLVTFGVGPAIAAMNESMGVSNGTYVLDTTIPVPASELPAGAAGHDPATMVTIWVQYQTALGDQFTQWFSPPTASTPYTTTQTSKRWVQDHPVQACPPFCPG